RRHTRFSRDWSSDVCSSDLSQPERFPESQQAHGEIEKERRRQESAKDSDIELLANEVSGTVSSRDTSTDPEDIAGVADIDRRLKIGRAACRERATSLDVEVR